jgi:Response regulator containing CheY-like receiver domain and AraC-type DNA-binding domain
LAAPYKFKITPENNIIVPEARIMLKNEIFHVMVVEDEIIILKHLISKINALPFPFEVSMSACNGKDALTLIKEAPPDIIFTDVKMPVMSGIQLIEEVHNHYPQTLAVIISGYEEFEYARQAIRFGVVDYLLKPVNEEKLYEVARRLYSAMQDRKRNETLQAINKALCGQLRDEEASSDEHLSVCLIKYGNLCTPQCEEIYREAVNRSRSDMHLDIWLCNYYQGSNGWWLIDEKDPSYQILIVLEPLILPQKDMFLNLIHDRQDSIAVNICEFPSPVVLSQLRTSVHALYDTIELKLVPYISGYNTVYTVSELQRQIPDPSFSEGLRLYLKPDQYVHLKEYLQQLLTSWKAGRIPQSHLLKYVDALFNFFSHHNIGSFCIEQVISQIQVLLIKCHSADELYKRLFLLLEEHVLIPLLESQRSAEVYQKIRKYIEINYPSAITMESLSEIFHLSPSYLSRIFKKYCKKSPINYLIEIRMNNAGKIITDNPGMDIKVIAELVGYSDQHYFSRYFKQFYNMSPTEYKNKATLSQ